METFALGTFVPRHLRHLEGQCVVMGDSRCLKLKAKGDAEGDEVSKGCSPDDLELCSCLAAVEGSLCVGCFTMESLQGISMQNWMVLMNA